MADETFAGGLGQSHVRGKADLPPSVIEAGDWPWHEPTTRAIVERLEASPHRVHHGAAKIIAAEFLPDGRIGKAIQMAADNGWPKEAVFAGLQLAKEPTP